jgi:hypothetical protein
MLFPNFCDSAVNGYFRFDLFWISVMRIILEYSLVSKPIHSEGASAKHVAYMALEVTYDGRNTLPNHRIDRM